MVGGRRKVAALFRAAAGTRGTIFHSGTLDGHVERHGSRDRGRRDLGEGGNSAFRPQEKGVKVGYHAPAEGSHSGVADYAETLKGALARLGLVGNGRVESGAETADIHLYHLGNNRLHERIYT